jgi:hypothetical protein
LACSPPAPVVVGGFGGVGVLTVGVGVLTVGVVGVLTVGVVDVLTVGVVDVLTVGVVDVLTVGVVDVLTVGVVGGPAANGVSRAPKAAPGVTKTTAISSRRRRRGSVLRMGYAPLVRGFSARYTACLRRAPWTFGESCRRRSGSRGPTAR